VQQVEGQGLMQSTSRPGIASWLEFAPSGAPKRGVAHDVPIFAGAFAGAVERESCQTRARSRQCAIKTRHG
jgi:hypothetical protein